MKRLIQKAAFAAALSVTSAGASAQAILWEVSATLHAGSYSGTYISTRLDYSPFGFTFDDSWNHWIAGEGSKIDFFDANGNLFWATPMYAEMPGTGEEDPYANLDKIPESSWLVFRALESEDAASRTYVVMKFRRISHTIPEPASIALFGLGLAAFGLRHRNS